MISGELYLSHKFFFSAKGNESSETSAQLRDKNIHTFLYFERAYITRSYKSLVGICLAYKNFPFFLYVGSVASSHYEISKPKASLLPPFFTSDLLISRARESRLSGDKYLMLSVRRGVSCSRACKSPRNAST